MATIKVKFRPSLIEGKKGTIYYQVIHRRAIRQIKTDYRIYADEWNYNSSRIRTPEGTPPDRCSILTSLQQQIDRDIQRIGKISRSLGEQPDGFSVDEIVAAFNLPDKESFTSFMGGIASQLKTIGKYRTAEIYETVMRSFSTTMGNKEIPISEITPENIQLYESRLLNKGLTRNTTSFYMRTLRAAYNRAVEKGLTVQQYPFRHAYTGIDKTVKRAIPLKYVKKIKNLDLSHNPNLDFARDMFLLSFYTRGMSFIDMAFLKHSDLQNGILTYCRHKTGQRLSIRWEKCMQDILDKYDRNNSAYMLPIIKNAGNISEERRQYRNAMRLINKKLKTVSSMVNLNVNLSMYVSRHSWASAAHHSNIPLAVISKGMGHDSETTTRIYLASIDTAAVDKANKTILKNL